MPCHTGLHSVVLEINWMGELLWGTGFVVTRKGDVPGPHTTVPLPGLHDLVACGCTRPCDQEGCGPWGVDHGVSPE